MSKNITFEKLLAFEQTPWGAKISQNVYFLAFFTIFLHLMPI